MLCFGYTTGIIAGALLYIDGSPGWQLSMLQKGALVSSVTLGAVLGTLVAGACREAPVNTRVSPSAASYRSTLSGAPPP
jgi:hypothetical protein